MPVERVAKCSSNLSALSVNNHSEVKTMGNRIAVFNLGLIE